MIEYHNRIKYYREKRNITQQELAQRLGTNVRNVRRWENEESIPDIITAMQISDALNADLERIFRPSKEDILE